MSKKLIRTLVTGIAATAMIAALTACGNTDAAEVAETAEVVEEAAENAEEVAADAAETAENAEDDGMMDLESQIQAVQDTLVYMGGLSTAEGSDKAIDIAMFRNDQGSIVYIYAVDGAISDYGMYETEDATTADGKTYSKVVGGYSEYGYYFNEDLVTGIIVDGDGNVYDAVELTEDGAREFVRQSLGG